MSSTIATCGFRAHCGRCVKAVRLCLSVVPNIIGERVANWQLLPFAKDAQFLVVCYVIPQSILREACESLIGAILGIEVLILPPRMSPFIGRVLVMRLNGAGGKTALAQHSSGLTSSRRCACRESGASQATPQPSVAGEQASDHENECAVRSNPSSSTPLPSGSANWWFDRPPLRLCREAFRLPSEAEPVRLSQWARHCWPRPHVR